jgi:hypothetical protein
LFAISACGTETPKIETVQIQTRPVSGFPPLVPTVDDLRLRQYEWIVVTEQNFEGVLMMLRDAGEDPVLYALTPNGYVSMMANQVDIMKVMRQQKEVIAVYKRSYED